MDVPIINNTGQQLWFSFSDSGFKLSLRTFGSRPKTEGLTPSPFPLITGETRTYTWVTGTPPYSVIAIGGPSRLDYLSIEDDH